MSEVEILTGNAVGETRSLWEEVFREDTEKFVDYYYSEKASDNLCFVKRERGQIVAMLHLTPYNVCVVKEDNTERAVQKRIQQEFPGFYIVGVATKEQHRHKGCMTLLLESAFSYMKKNGILFTFLMPADPAIYEPFGFRYIYERADYEYCPDVLLERSDIQVQKAQEKDFRLLADFAMEQLGREYQFFLKREEGYYRILQKELASENGCIYLIHVEGEFAGYFTYARETEEFLQEVLIKEQYRCCLTAKEGAAGEALLVEKAGRKPVIMGKYLHNDFKSDFYLEEIAAGKNRHGFINELV